MSEVKLTLDKFDIAKQEVRTGCEKAVRAIAFAIQEQAIHNIQVNQQIDTGAMRNGLYVETSSESNRAEVIAKAMAAAASPGAKTGKPIDDPQVAAYGTKPRKLQAKCAECMEHGIYQEMGVQGSAYGNLPARPYLAPAVETIRGKAKGAVAEYIREELGS